MTRRAKILVAFVVGLGLVYACGPILAGFFQIGDREGPTCYSEEFHICLYDLACKARTGEKPKSALRNVLYNRPLFYGQPWRPKQIGERYAIQAYYEMRKEPIQKEIREWNLEIDNGSEPSKGGGAE